MKEDSKRTENSYKNLVSLLKYEEPKNDIESKVMLRVERSENAKQRIYAYVYGFLAVFSMFFSFPMIAYLLSELKESGLSAWPAFETFVTILLIATFIFSAKHLVRKLFSSSLHKTISAACRMVKSAYTRVLSR